MQHDKHCEGYAHINVRQCVTALIVERLHAGAAFAAVVAAGFHCEGEVIRTAECRNEKRDEERDHSFSFVYYALSVERGTAGHLSLHDFVGLIAEDWDETQSNRHHHRDLVNRHMDVIQETKTSLKAVGQLVRSCRKSHDRCSDDQVDHSDKHQHSSADTLNRDLYLAPFDERVTWCKEYIKNTAAQKQDDYRL